MIFSVFLSQDSFTRAKKWVQELQKQGIFAIGFEVLFMFLFPEVK